MARAVCSSSRASLAAGLRFEDNLAPVVAILAQAAAGGLPGAGIGRQASKRSRREPIANGGWFLGHLGPVLGLVLQEFGLQ